MMPFLSLSFNFRIFDLLVSGSIRTRELKILPDDFIDVFFSELLHIDLTHASILRRLFFFTWNGTRLYASQIQATVLSFASVSWKWPNKKEAPH